MRSDNVIVMKGRAGDVLRLPALPSIAAAPNEPVTLEEANAITS